MRNYYIVLTRDLGAPIGTVDGRSPAALAKNWGYCEGVYPLARAREIAAGFHRVGIDCQLLSDDLAVPQGMVQLPIRFPAAAIKEPVA